MNIEHLKNTIRNVPDFPKPGILFRDINPILRDPLIWNIVINDLSEICKELKPTHIAGIESRGFIMAPPAF